MHIIKIYGYSDDLVEVEGVYEAIDDTDTYNYDVMGSDNRAEYNVYEPASFMIGDSLLVHSNYNRRGVWNFTVDMVEEGSFPNWPIRVVQAHDYSLQLEIDVPDFAANGKIRRIK